MTSLREAKQIKVLIGQVHLVRSPHRLQAVLGSCIAAVVYDPTERLAGMAHVLLPDSTGRQKGTLAGKYADEAIPCLCRGLREHGGAPGRFRAKIAGGARMFRRIREGGVDVGRLNIEAIEAALKAEGVPLLGSHVGGDAGRKVEFLTESLELVVEDFAARKEIL